MTATRTPSKLAILLFCLGFGLLPGLARARSADGSGPPLSIPEAVSFLLKALGLHRSQATARPGPFVIAVVHAPEVPGSLVKQVREAFAAHQGFKIHAKEIKTVEVTYRDPTSLKKALEQAGAAAVYITADSRSITRAVLNVTRDLKILSITAEADYVHWLGASLGVERRAGKPKLLINLSGCKNEGIEFDPRLLQLASVYF